MMEERLIALETKMREVLTLLADKIAETKKAIEPPVEVEDDDAPQKD